MDRKTLLGGAAVALLTAVAFFNPGSSLGTALPLLEPCRDPSRNLPHRLVARHHLGLAPQGPRGGASSARSLARREAGRGGDRTFYEPPEPSRRPPVL